MEINKELNKIHRPAFGGLRMWILYVCLQMFHICVASRQSVACGRIFYFCGRDSAGLASTCTCVTGPMEVLGGGRLALHRSCAAAKSTVAEHWLRRQAPAGEAKKRLHSMSSAADRQYQQASLSSPCQRGPSPEKNHDVHVQISRQMEMQACSSDVISDVTCI